MAVDLEKSEIQSEIGIKHVMNFVKQSWKKIIIFAGFSFAITVFLIVLGYIVLPREISYTSSVRIQLPKQKHTIVYPNGKVFSATDIISTAVLRRVYDNRKIEKKIPFDKFCGLFSLTGLDIERAKLAANFKDKLSNKKNTVVELKELEIEYNRALQRLDDGKISISMLASSEFSGKESAQILNDVADSWFKVYSKQEARVFPRVDSVTHVAGLHQNLRRDGKIISLDKARLVCHNLQVACRNLDEIVLGAKIALNSGETLGELRERLGMLHRHRILPMLLISTMFSEYKHPVDAIALQACIVSLDKSIQIASEKYEGVVTALQMLRASESITSNVSASSKEKPSTINMALDGTFVTSLEVLIRNASTVEMREHLTKRALDYKEELAELKAEKEYYVNLLNTSRSNQKAGLSKEQLKAMEDNMFVELIDLCRKVNEFRELIFKEHVQNRIFYTTTGSVEKYSDFKIPFKRVVLALLFLLVLVNMANAGKLFYVAYNSGKLND